MRAVDLRIGDIVVRRDPMKRGATTDKWIEVVGVDDAGNLQVKGNTIFDHNEVITVYKQNFKRFFTEVYKDKRPSWYHPTGSGEAVATVLVSNPENWDDSVQLPEVD